MPRSLLRRTAGFLGVLAIWSLVSVGFAADSYHRILGFERFHAQETLNAVEAGQLLLGELNCASCHQLDKAWDLHVQRKAAPILDKVGERVRPEYLRKFLADPQGTKPGTTMPHLLAGGTESERRQQIEALVHFLASTGTISEAAPLRQAVNRGEALYHTVGCVACHGHRKPDRQEPTLATSIPLGTPSKKLTIPSLAKFLQDPLLVRPSGRMPHFNLTEPEARDIASFLLNDLDISSGLQFAYYEGAYDKLPDFKKLTPKDVGEAGSFDVAVAKRKDNFALRFDGFVNIPEDGTYMFLLSSDDGSKLYVDEQVVIDNDAVHAPQQKRKPIKLKAGLHSVAVEYFEAGGGEELQVEVIPPGKPQQPLETFIAIPKKKDAPPANSEFMLDSSLAAKGKELFSTLGCASCHQLKLGNERIVSKALAPELASLKTTGGGCLTGTASAKFPQFAFSEAQKKSLAAAIEAMKQPARGIPNPNDLARRTMVQANCYACHERDKVGGVEEARDVFFTTVQPEMGDEGRLPPQLTSVGAKLRTAALKEIFEKGAKERPYMVTRMPRFGLLNVGHLVPAFEEADKGRFPPAPEPGFSFEDRKVKAAGRRLVGTQVFGCIKCHTFAGKKSPGIQGIDMTLMTKRLRPDWFYAYLINPQAIRRGTRMPSAWPNGETQLPNVLDGSTTKQIMSIWSYLADGDKAQQPVGLVTGAIELIASNEAVIYRNFIDGGGSRAIGVGHPEKLNLAWDANHLRLAMIWHGGFMDAKRHWTGRGEGFEKPLGDNILNLPEGATLALLDSQQDNWPSQPPKEIGFRFGGYRLGDKMRPTFLFSLNDVEVEDEIRPIGTDDVYTFQRKLRLSAPAPVANLYFRAAVGNKITAAENGWYEVDGRWKVKLGGKQPPFVRQSQGKEELLLPVTFAGGKAEIVEEIDW